MLERDAALVENAIKEYYFNHHDLIPVPPKIGEREFGYQKFNGGMTRHIAIRDIKELHLLLMRETPSDVYCSNAYYSFPSMPMRAGTASTSQKRRSPSSQQYWTGTSA